MPTPKARAPSSKCAPHEVPFILEDGQRVGQLIYEMLSTEPAELYGSGIGSNYQNQGLRLSKHFAVDLS